MSLLRKLWPLGRSGRGVAPPFDAALAPEAPFFAIGDIHGQMAELTRAVALVHDTAKAPTIVCVGDYIDRGEQSADVLRYLQRMSQQRDDAPICLMGNHEHMCLQFLDDPEKYGDRWFRNGGLQTLSSFGIRIKHGAARTETRNALALAMGEDLIGWLRALPGHWRSGNVAVTHAGADPSRPIPDQPVQSLIWGHPDFETIPRSDGMWIVHGHTIVDQPTVGAGRIAIDTGAYATGRLTVAHITRDGVSFLTARAASAGC